MPKHKLAAVLALTLLTASHGWAAQPLAGLKGKFRVVVVSAASATDSAFLTQNQWLKAAREGLRERDVIVIQLVGSVVQAPDALKLDAKALRRALGLAYGKFSVALVGKDGSEALRQSEPISLQSLFGTIDAMPMRQAEIARPKP